MEALGLVGVLNLARQVMLQCLKTGQFLSCVNAFQASLPQALQTDAETLLHGGEEPFPPLRLRN